MGKEDVACIHNGALLSCEREEWNSGICHNMDLPRDCHPGWNKTEKDKYLISLIRGIYKKKKRGINSFTHKTKSHRCKKQTYGYQGRKVGG